MPIQNLQVESILSETPHSRPGVQRVVTELEQTKAVGKLGSELNTNRQQCITAEFPNADARPKKAYM